MRTILVVDDETPILGSLEMFLGEKGYRIITAATGAEGEIKFRQHHPAPASRPFLILSDES